MMHGTIVDRIITMICLFEPYFHICVRLLMRIRLKHACVIFGILMLLDLFGAFTHMFEHSYRDHFTYPYEGDIQSSVEALKHNKKPHIQPINQYNYSYIHDIKNHCIDNDHHTLRIIFLIKSACGNFESRRAIRNSWGFKKRFFNVPTRTLFLLGKQDDDSEMQMKIDEESKKHQDIMQADFIDVYYNNTIKTMMGFKWVVTYCLNAQYYMFLDDDMYVSVKNVLRFIRNPKIYPTYQKETSGIGSVKLNIRESDEPSTPEHIHDSSIKNTFHNHEYNSSTKLHRYGEIGTQEDMAMRHESAWTTDNDTIVSINEVINTVIIYNQTNIDGKSMNFNEMAHKLNSSRINNLSNAPEFSEHSDDVRLAAGFVRTAGPERAKISKWYVPLREYAFDLWPPFIPAGAYILSRAALVDMYYTSFYTKHLRFDDVFLGLVAKKAKIELFHCDDFHIKVKDYTKINYENAIAIHGLGNPERVLNVWNKQKALGNA